MGRTLSGSSNLFLNEQKDLTFTSNQIWNSSRRLRIISGHIQQPSLFGIDHYIGSSRSTIACRRTSPCHRVSGRIQLKTFSMPGYREGQHFDREKYFAFERHYLGTLKVHIFRMLWMFTIRPLAKLPDTKLYFPGMRLFRSYPVRSFGSLAKNPMGRLPKY